MAYLTLDDIQKLIHSHYEGSIGSVPASTDDDYLTRTKLINEGIGRWYRAEGVLWRELFASSVGAPGAGLTVLAATTQYALPSDFSGPSALNGYVRLVDANNNVSYYKVVKPQNVGRYEGQTGPICYVTGNQSSGFKLNFLPGSGSSTFPSASQIGNTIKYEYYKIPLLMANTADIPEMSDPYFLVHFVLSVLYTQDSNSGESDNEFQKAEALLKQMQTANLMGSWFEDDKVEDQQTGYENQPGFGN